MLQAPELEMLYRWWGPKAAGEEGGLRVCGSKNTVEQKSAEARLGFLVTVICSFCTGTGIQKEGPSEEPS